MWILISFSVLQLVNFSLTAKAETSWNWPVEIWVECPEEEGPIRDWGSEPESGWTGNSTGGSS